MPTPDIDTLLPVGPTHVERVPSRPYGATKRQWAQAWRLAGKNVFPNCDDPNVSVSANSNVVAGSKAPARIRVGDGLLTGFWHTDRAKGSTPQDIREYAQDARHGIGILCNRVRALDIDFKEPAPGVSLADHQALTARILADIRSELPRGYDMPMRWRPTAQQMQGATTLTDIAHGPDSGSYVLLYRFIEDDLADLVGDTPEPFGKRYIETPVGRIEVQGDDCYQILACRHASGQPQLWNLHGIDGFDLPSYADIPAISRADLEAFINYMYGAYPHSLNTHKLHPNAALPVSTADPTTDPVISFVEQLGTDLRWKRLRDGQYACTCPNQAQHDKRSKDNDTTTVYLPEGWNGHARGFNCKHAHCDRGQITVAAFLKHVGFTTQQTLAHFSPTVQPPTTAVTRLNGHALNGHAPVAPLAFQANGTLLKTDQHNINNLLMHPNHCRIMFSNDTFTGRARYSIDGEPAKPLHEATSNEIYMHLVDHCSIPHNCPLPVIENGIELALMTHSHSSAAERLKQLTHDGVPRLEGWLARALGLPNNDYLLTLGVYILTSLVGRLLEPGLKTDITPIFYGPPGMRKSTLVERLALMPEWATEANLEQRDKELTIQLLGKCVVELPELRGFNTREAEGVKAWLTSKADNFRIPYAKFSYDRLRQFVTIGTTNDYIFLTERLSLRRFAPCEVPKPIDTDYVSANIEQLYAEAVAHFIQKGTPWAKLEQAALPYCQAVSLRDAWEYAIEEWLTTPGNPINGFTLTTLMTQALGLRIAQLSASNTIRVTNILRHMGAKADPAGQWTYTKGTHP